MDPPKDSDHRKLAINRRALHDYHVLDRLEAGIELRGTEVKSVRSGQVSLAGSFARVESGQVWLCNLSIPPYAHGNRFNHDPLRVRRLLLHRRQIDRLQGETELKGHTLIPLSLYLRRGWVKVELGICRGKRQADKRGSLRRREAEREAQRVLRARR